MHSNATVAPCTASAASDVEGWRCAVGRNETNKRMSSSDTRHIVCAHCAAARKTSGTPSPPASSATAVPFKVITPEGPPYSCLSLHESSDCERDMFDPRIMWAFEGDLPAPPPQSPVTETTLARRVDGGGLTYLYNGKNECFKVAAWGMLALIPGFVDAFITRVRSKQDEYHPFFILNTYLAFVRMSSRPRQDPYPDMTSGVYGTIHFLKTGVSISALYLDLAPSWYDLLSRRETQQRKGDYPATIVETEGVALNAQNVATTCAALMVRVDGNHFVLDVRKDTTWYRYNSLDTNVTLSPSTGTIVAALVLGEVTKEQISALRQ